VPAIDQDENAIGDDDHVHDTAAMIGPNGTVADDDRHPPPLARLEDVEKYYSGRRALGPLTLEIPRGTIGLLGPNGAGKTTLIRTLMGLLPHSGNVEVLGERVTPGAKAVRRRIGYMPEGEAQFPGMNGVQAVVTAGRLAGMGKAAAMQRAHQVLDYVGLDESRYRIASSYSTGMRQRLKLAQALVHDPELLILDEPTEGVDPEAREEILKLIQELSDLHGIQVLMSTHLLADVERIAQHAIVLNEGRVVVHGALEDIRRPTTAAYTVRVYGDIGPLTKRLDKARIAWQPEPPGVRVEAGEPRMLLQQVAEAGLVIRHLAPVRLSLTDAYEHAVSQSGAPAEGGEASD
jgi:ABC-2 type transport system ATP-binding protein